MKKTVIKISLLAVILFAVNGILFSQEKVDLKYQMPKGKTYLYRTVISSIVTQENMGREMKFSNDVHSVTRVVVDSTDDDGNISLIISPDSVTVHNHMQGRDTTLSLEGLIGKRTRLDISKYGNIIKKSIIDSLSTRAEMAGSSIMQSIINLYAKLPGKEIADGDSWKDTKTDSVNSMGGNIIIKSDYTYSLKGKENKNGSDCYKIEYTAAIASHGNASISGMEFYIEGSGKMTGTIYTSVSDGAIFGIEGKNENNMNLATTGDQKMVIPVSQSSTLKTLLINN